MVAPSPKGATSPANSKRWNAPFENDVVPGTFVASECRQLRRRDHVQDATPPLLMYVGRFIDSLFNPEGPGVMKVATACMQDTSICTLEDTTFDETVDWKTEASTPEWLPDIIMHAKGDDDVSMDLTFDGSYLDPRSRELLGIQQSGKRVYRISPLLDSSKRLESAPSDENSLEPSLLPSLLSDNDSFPVSNRPSSIIDPSTLPRPLASSTPTTTALRDQQSEPRDNPSRPLPTNTAADISPIHLQHPKHLSESGERHGVDQTWNPSNSQPASHFKIVSLDNDPAPSKPNNDPAPSKPRSRGIWLIHRNRRSHSKDPAAAKKGKGRFRFLDRRGPATTDKATMDVNNRYESSSSGNEASSEVASTRNDAGAITRSVHTAQSFARESLSSYSPSIHIQDSTPSLDRPSPMVVVVKSLAPKPTLTAMKSDKLTETSPLGLAILQNISSSGSSDEMEDAGSTKSHGGNDADSEGKASSNTDQAQGSARRRIRHIFSKDSVGSYEKRALLFSKGKARLLTKKVVAVEEEEREPTES